MPTPDKPPRPWFGVQHMHLLGRLLDRLPTETLEDPNLGIAPAERQAAEALFADLDAYLTAAVGPAWDDTEALV